MVALYCWKCFQPIDIKILPMIALSGKSVYTLELIDIMSCDKFVFYSPLK
jgi:hypothetical protein